MTPRPMYVAIDFGQHPEAKQNVYVSLMGGNGETIWPSEAHSLRYARRKGRKLALLLGVELKDRTRWT